MSRRNRLVSVLLAVLFLASSSELLAQTTGRIFGQVLDAQGAVVPGATITVTSPALQGAQTQVSDPEGRFRFLEPASWGLLAESGAGPASVPSSKTISTSVSTAR